MKNYMFYVLSFVLIGCAGTAQEKKKAAPEEKNTEKNQEYEVHKTETEWKEQLTTKQYYILRQAGTEFAFSGEYYKKKEDGVYQCAGCGNPLYATDNQYSSGTGWPSFDRAVDDQSVGYEEDFKLGMRRTEVHCARCGGHLGHVFNDGPTETTGKRHCINSAALNFKESLENN